MMGFDSLNTASRVRDTIEHIVSGVLKRERPEPFLAKVYDVDTNIQRARVMPVGQDSENLLTVNYALDKTPTVKMVDRLDLGDDAPGDIVRVMKMSNAYFILDFFAGHPSGSDWSINHGNLSGDYTLAVDSASLHEMVLTGNLDLTPTGGLGSVAEIKIDGAGNLNLIDTFWDGSGLTVPGSVLLRRFTSGWRAVAIQFPPTVTPAGVTFTDGGLNVISMVNPSETLVTYLVDGNPIVFTGGDSSGWPAGLTNVTWAPVSGQIANPAHVDDSWSHTFGALTSPPLLFTDVANLVKHYKSDVVGALTLFSTTHVGTWRNEVAVGTNDLVQATDANRPVTVTVNGKTWIQFVDSTDQMQATSLTSPASTTDNTVACVIRADHATGGGVAGLPATFVAAMGFSAGSITQPPVHIRVSGTGTPPEVTNIAGNGNLLFVMYTIPATGPTDLWVGDLSTTTLTKVTSTITAAALAHLFVGGGAAKFTVAQIGIWSELKGDTEAAGLFSGAKVAWT